MFRFLTSVIRRAALVALGVGISSIESVAAPATVSDPDNKYAAEVIGHYNAAMQAFTEGKWAAAAEGFEKVLSMLIDPQAQLKMGHVHYTLGAAYFNAANYPKALESFRTFLTKYPNDARAGETRMGIARATFLSRDFTGALKLFAELEGVPALREMSLSAQAECYKELGQADGQIQALEKLIAPEIKTAGQATGAMTLMEAYAAKGELEKALRLVNLLYAKVGLLDNVVALNVATVKLGDVLAEKQAFPQAIAAYHGVRSRDQVIAFQKDRLAAMDRRMRAALEAARGNPQAYVAAVSANREIAARQSEAKKLLAEIEKLPDHAPAILIRTAKAWYDWDKKWEAIVAFERLKTEFPAAKEAELALYSQTICYGDLNRPQRTLRLCDEYLEKFPQGTNAATVGYLKGAAALQNNDPKSAVTYFGTMLERQPESEFREQMRFLLGNSHFMQGQYAEARKEYQRYTEDFPKGTFYEEAVYRNALTLIFEGDYEAALAAFKAYLEQFKGGTFAPDGRYRVMVCKYAGSLYDEIIADADSWRRDFPNHEMTGEVLALLGDALAAQDKTAEAAEVYTRAYKAATTDEVLNYALFEASKQLQKLGQWPGVGRVFEEFVREKPDHSAVVAAMFWIGKAKSRTGQPEEAKAFLVENLKRYLNEPKREAVEQLLEQLAQLCAKRPRPSTPASEPAATGATPGATPVPAATPPPYDAVAELKKQLAPLEADANATGQARLLYAQAQLFKLAKREPEARRIYGEIATGFESTQLSPVLLAVTGDHLLSQGERERAAKFYADLREDYPKSNYLDYAYVGLGEIALAEGRFQEALDLFTHAADEIAGAKMKEATIGKARAQLELGLLAEAKKGFEQVASIREWRGEATAQAVYHLGEVEARQGHWPEAIAHYQRVFVAYQKYLPWAAKAYVRSAECFEKMGQRAEAIGHLKEMLRNERLRDFAETKEANRMLADWGAAG